jgi:hypothetical protein
MVNRVKSYVSALIRLWFFAEQAGRARRLHPAETISTLYAPFPAPFISINRHVRPQVARSLCHAQSAYAHAYALPVL